MSINIPEVRKLYEDAVMELMAQEQKGGSIMELFMTIPFLIDEVERLQGQG